MSFGSIELYALVVPDNQLILELPALIDELLQDSARRIADILFVHRASEGELVSLELNAIAPQLYAQLRPRVAETSGILQLADATPYASSLAEEDELVLLALEELEPGRDPSGGRALDSESIRFLRRLSNASGEFKKRTAPTVDSSE